ncbi:MAG: hypothetical protein U7126_20590 [Microcoleus sp.]
MTVNITIIELQKTENTNEFEIVLLIDNKEHHFIIYVFDREGILGLSLKDELTKILCRNSEKNKYFISLVLNFYRGSDIKLPIILGEF